ncbi:hypothetical protein GCM10010129_77610 [Streptomyces fumigatiscleroticus]|nr:hypothetical protein GCM10010129_77610 [Streptomyces fumigatiscleroticus]
MRANTRIRRSLWRWRRNPLRRREDVVEGWLLLATWLVIAVGGPWAGAMSAQATQETLAQRRAERHPATAVLVGAPADSPGTTVGQAFATVRWTAPDGTRHTGRALVDVGRKGGERVVVWTDRRDRLTTRPPTPVQAEAQAVTMGATAALALAGAAGGGYCGARIVLDRHRRRAWDAEWQDVGSQWGRTAG